MLACQLISPHRQAPLISMRGTSALEHFVGEELKYHRVLYAQ